MNKNYPLNIVTEGNTNIFVFKNKETIKGPGSKEGLPFYNPSMEQNRDLSIIVCQWLINNSKKHVNILDGLAASGIRGIRVANELIGDFKIQINDWNLDAFNLIKKNIEKLGLKNAFALNYNLNTLLSDNKYDYIDIDPFGSPVYFIDSAMRSINNYGIIACTATDTATLCGTYPNVCFRRYGAIPFHSPVMKEIGLRILLGFICKAAGVYDRGIKPIICYSSDHYFRIYVMVINGTTWSNDSMSNYKTIKSNNIFSKKTKIIDVGPIWNGKLNNRRIIEELRTILFQKKLKTRNEIWKLLDLCEEESDAPMFFYTTNDISAYLNVSPPKFNTVFKILKNKGYDVFRTHFSSTGFKTDAPRKEIEKVFK